MTLLPISSADYPSLQKSGDHILYFDVAAVEQTRASQGACCPLSHFAVLCVSGTDATTFLQGQLTCDVTSATVSHSIMGAYCDRKGRVLVNFHLVKINEDRYGLVMPTSMLDDTQNSLQKYAMFSKVKIEIATDLSCIGYTSETNLPTLPDTPILSIANQRWIALISQQAFAETWQQSLTTYCPIGINTWDYLNIMEMLTYVTPSTSLRFLPQMLNLNHFKAISFNKGCYIGQEIVARSEHLGTIKKSLVRMTLPAATPIGESLPDSTATVMSIVPTEDQWLALVVAREGADS